MASSIEDVEKRIADKSVVDRLRELARRAAARSRRQEDAAPDAKVAETTDKPRLFFDLRSAEIHPRVHGRPDQQKTRTAASRGLWDKGMRIGTDRAFGIGWLLTLVVSSVAVLAA